MKTTHLKILKQLANFIVLLMLMVGCGRNDPPTLSIKPAVYDMTQNRTLTVDRQRGTGSFVSHDEDSWSNSSRSPRRPPGPFGTEAFDIHLEGLEGVWEETENLHKLEDIRPGNYRYFEDRYFEDWHFEDWHFEHRHDERVFQKFYGPNNSILRYSADGSFSFTPPENFQGVARFKIRWLETHLEFEATQADIYSAWVVPSPSSPRRMRVSLRRASPNNLRDWDIVSHNQPYNEVWTDVIIFVKGPGAPAKATNKRPLFEEESWTKRSKIYSSYLKYDHGSMYGTAVQRQFFKSKFYLEDGQFLIESFDSPKRYVNSQASLVFNDVFDIDPNETRAGQIRSSGLLLGKFLYEDISADIDWIDETDEEFPGFNITMESDIYEHADEQTRGQIDFVTQSNNQNFYRSEDTGSVHTKLGTFYPGVFPIPNLDYAAKVDSSLPDHSELEGDSIYHYFTFSGSDTFTLSSYLSGTNLEWTDQSEDFQFTLLDNELQSGVFVTEVLEQSGSLRGVPFEKLKVILTYSDNFNRCYLDVVTDSLELINETQFETVVNKLVDEEVSYIVETDYMLVHRLGPFNTLHGYENFSATGSLDDNIEIVTKLHNHSRDSMTLQKAALDFSNTPVPGEPSVQSSQAFYSAGDEVLVSFTGGQGNPKDWVGIYTEGSQPGEDASVRWHYVDGTDAGNEAVKDGTLIFEDLMPGSYSIYLLLDDGYENLASNSFKVLDAQNFPEVQSTTMVFKNVDREDFWTYSQLVSPASGVWNGFPYYNSAFESNFSEDFDSVEVSVSFDVIAHAGEDDKAQIIELIESNEQLEFSDEDGFVTWNVSRLQSDLGELSAPFYEYDDFFPGLENIEENPSKGGSDGPKPIGMWQNIPIKSYQVKNGSLHFSFQTEQGFEYIIETTNQIDTPEWKTISSENGTGDLANFNADVNASSEGYFRVKKVMKVDLNVR
ncbi:hypothetical protein OAH23_14230 [Verrucomicrobia bacterium]|nr:hypothetical protein [Verrucomicrobiota bacterium]